MKGKRYASLEVFLDMHIGMQPLVIDWAKEEAKMAKIIRHMYVYCYNNSIFKLTMRFF